MENFCRKRDHLRQTRTLMLITIMATTAYMQYASSEPTLHRVGGKAGWTQNINYTEWANQELFYLRDWLIFYFDKHMYNVLEVNKTNYEQCRDQDFITNITKGGRDVFELKEAKPYYFLSGRGFCWSGMKFVISVHQTPPLPAPAPASSKSASPVGSSTITLSLAFSVALIWALYI